MPSVTGVVAHAISVPHANDDTVAYHIGLFRLNLKYAFDYIYRPEYPTLVKHNYKKKLRQSNAV